MSSPLSVKINNYIKNPKRSNIQTPDYICNFIAKLFPNAKTIFDPCSGKGNLLKPFKNCKIISFEKEEGIDFLQYQNHIDCDLVVCNPPFNLGVGKQLGSEVFLRHILEVCGNKIPIILFVPMGFRLNQRKTSKRWKWLRDTTPEITSIISLPLDAFEGVQFHSEILIFNANNLKPHYFLDL